MNRNPVISKLTFTLVFALIAWSALVSNLQAQTENRIASVEKLIESSSAAAQIEESGQEDAINGREMARGLYQQALQAYEGGQTEKADALLQQATQAMFEAVRLAGNGEINVDKMRRDFSARMQSVDALMQAYERISVEKNNPARAELEQEVERKLASANSLFDAGALDRAREELDRAYLMAKTSIEELRGGDTLVRSLNFASKEEEYRYELDRNDTHEMLVTVLLNDKLQQNTPNQMTEQFINKAKSLRDQAEQEASKGEFENAIKTLENSTSNLVRAIRSAGVYIPG